MNDTLVLGGHGFSSRLLLGTGKYSDNETMRRAVAASGTQLVTAALRRFNRDRPGDDLLAPLLAMGVTLAPNTSGARDAREAIQAAHLARELCGSLFVKVEIHPNPHHLMPDPIETYTAARELVKEGFVVLPYMPADPVLAKRLEDVGCAAVMPLGAGIGTGGGLSTVEMLRLIVHNSGIPVIVDAGLRSPSDAAAGDPPAMAAAFALAVQAGRAAFHAGIMGRGNTAVATSPLTDFTQE